MTSNNYGIVDYFLNGESKILGYSKLKNNWTVVVALTKAEAFYKLNRTILFLVFINSAITIIMTCFSIFIALYLNTLITRNTELEKMVGDRTHELIVTNEYLEESMAELENSQAELTMLNDQLQTSLETVNEMQEKLIMSEKLSSMGELITGVAHEINTPLGNSITMISFIKAHTDEFKEKYNSQGITRDMFNEYLKDQIDSISIVERALIRLKELVDAFKLITIDKTLIDIKQVQACLMVDDLVKGFDELLREGNHIINIDCEEDLTFTTYPVVLRQIFKQLISNSILHGFEGIDYGVINIKIRMVEEYIFIDYSDNGKGISKNLTFKVFEPFYTTRRNKGNAGLGLHIVHNLVTKTLNGDITIDSDLGNGVKLYISFKDLL